MIARSLPARALVILSGFLAFTGSAAADEPDQVFVYTWPAIEGAGMPAAVVERRKVDQALVTACGTRPAWDRSALVGAVLIKGIGWLLDALNKAAAEREERYIASLSATTSAAASYAQFPVSSRTGRQCVLIDRVSAAGEDRATYVLGLTPVGTTAYTIEVVGARLSDTALINRKGLPDKVTADLSMTINTVQKDGAGRLQQVVAGSYSASISDLNPKLVQGAGNDPARVMSGALSPHRSPVLALPGADTPTTISIAVVESNAGLAKAKQRVALIQKLRTEAITLIGGALEDQIKKATQ